MSRVGLLCGVALKSVVRTRGLWIGTGLTFGLIMLLAWLVGGTGPGESTVAFYVTCAWLLLVAYALTLAVLLPLGFFARAQETRRMYLLGTRPVGRGAFVAARFLATCVVCGCVILSGCGVILLGTSIVARRCDQDLRLLAGCVVYPAEPREKDPGLLGLQRDESTVIRWQGLPREIEEAHIRYTPQVYPPWAEATIEFSVGDLRVRRQVTSGMPGELALQPAVRALGESIDLAVSVTSDTDMVVYFPQPDGLAVYVPVISYGANLVRAGVLLITLAGALAGFGVLAGATLSPSVGALAGVVLVVFCLGYGIFTESVEGFTETLSHHHHGEAPPELLSQPVRRVWQAVMRYALAVAPHAVPYDPGRELVEGRSIRYGALVEASCTMLGARGGGALLLAWLLYRRRELARRR